jgi:hypothetical protein
LSLSTDISVYDTILENLWKQACDMSISCFPLISINSP